MTIQLKLTQEEAESLSRGLDIAIKVFGCFIGSDFEAITADLRRLQRALHALLSGREPP